MLCFNLFYSLDEKNTVDMKSAGQPEQASLSEWPKSHVLHMLVHRIFSNENDTRALIGPCSLLTSRWYQTRDQWHVQPFTIAHIVIGLSQHIHSCIHLSFIVKILTGKCLEFLYWIKERFRLHRKINKADANSNIKIIPTSFDK